MKVKLRIYFNCMERFLEGEPVKVFSDKGSQGVEILVDAHEIHYLDDEKIQLKQTKAPVDYYETLCQCTSVLDYLNEGLEATKRRLKSADMSWNDVTNMQIRIQEMLKEIEDHENSLYREEL